MLTVVLERVSRSYNVCRMHEIHLNQVSVLWPAPDLRAGLAKGMASYFFWVLFFGRLAGLFRLRGHHACWVPPFDLHRGYRHLWAGQGEAVHFDLSL